MKGKNRPKGAAGYIKNSKPAANMKASIVIPTKNEEKKLPGLLESIKRAKPDAEIIVVDAGSEDRTVEIARKYGCTVITETGKKSPANAKNIGIKNSGGDIIVLLNSDQILDKNFFKEIEKTGGWDALYQKEVVFKDTLVERLFALRCCRTGYTRFPHVFKKHVFGKARFDPNLAIGEEDDLVKNIAASGFISGRCNAIIRGHMPETLRGLYVQLRWYGRTAPNYYAKHKETGVFRMLLFLLLPFLFFGHPLSVFSLPVWFFEAMIMARTFLGSHDMAVFLFPIFDFLRGIFFLVGVLESLFGDNRVGR